ncbi:MAG TPA: hypothetical protein VGF59_23575 [Bryobacteraceae bacterium]|jgi:ElaB/YqjD/DUF883 family membrane-anchored ribosome-binding protein
MADEITPAEVERSRETSARLRDTLARKLKIAPAVRQAANGVQCAAQYLQEHSVKDLASGLDRAVRQRPGAAILAAVAAGFVVGTVIRRR